MIDLIFLVVLAIVGGFCVIEAWHERDFPRDTFPYFAALLFVFALTFFLT